MEIRKMFKVGNSFAVSIPPDWVREMHLEDQPVEVVRNEDNEIIIRPTKRAGITPDFVQTVDGFLEEYGDVLERLAKR